MLKYIILTLFSVTLFFACSSSSDSSDHATHSAQKPASKEEGLVVDGSAVYKKYCVLCHGASGNLGTNGAKDLGQSQLDKAQRIAMIQNGKGLMTPFKEILSEEEIEAVAEYTFTFKSE